MFLHIRIFNDIRIECKQGMICIQISGTFSFENTLEKSLMCCSRLLTK